MFSDAAKFADIARNLVAGFGYGSSFTFWSMSVFNSIKQNIFSASVTPPVMPFSFAAFFSFFGVNDMAVIATSSFYFLLTLIFTFLLAKKVFRSNLVAILSTVVIGLNQDLINYATNGASEAPFIFEIVAASYFISFNKKWGTVVALAVMVLMYFTRSQSFIYIAGLILYWLLVRFKTKKAVYIFSFILLGGFLIDFFILPKFGGRYFLYSVTSRGMGTATQVLAGVSASDSLRGLEDPVATVGILQLAKKIFYNLYNFIKLLPQIISPYLFALFVIGLFMKTKNKVVESFKTSVVFTTLITFLVTAASIPFFRYLHPVIPLIYIIAVGTLVELFSKSEYLNSKRLYITLASLFTILIFGVSQTLGVIFLDSRFEKNTHNIGRPPVYVEFSRILKENTSENQIVITNLDTWGSWYGERKTIWFPLDPKQLIDPATGKIPFDIIYLTSYLMDDQNYYMGKDWRMIFDNPEEPKKWTCVGCSEIAKEFVLDDVYIVSANSNYERQDAKAILLIKK